MGRSSQSHLQNGLYILDEFLIRIMSLYKKSRSYAAIKLSVYALVILQNQHPRVPWMLFSLSTMRENHYRKALFNLRPYSLSK